MAAPAAVKPTVGKKLLAPVAKANLGNAASAASTPVEPPSVAPAKKATALVTEKAPAGDGPSPKGTGKGKNSEAEKAPKAPRAKNAYMFFMADKRDTVKGELMFASPCLPCLWWVGQVGKHSGVQVYRLHNWCSQVKYLCAWACLYTSFMAGLLLVSRQFLAHTAHYLAEQYCWYEQGFLSLAAAETPGISIGDIAKAIGEMWRGLSEEHKNPYQVTGLLMQCCVWAAT